MELLHYHDTPSKLKFDSEHVITTLGPKGTSSWATAKAFSDEYGGAVLLFDTYEAAERELANHPGKGLLIVANAYREANRFYISEQLIPVCAFFKTTPAYVLATKGRDELCSSNIKIATHHAPAHLLDRLGIKEKLTVIDAPSTRKAADLVSEGQADACITTQIAAEHLSLKVLKTLVDEIPMLWTVFGERFIYG